MRLVLLALLAGLVLTVAGCGGTENAATMGEGAASLAPKSAALYASINTDLASGQVDQLEELLAKFPDRDRLLDELESSLAKEDVSWETDIKPALGTTLDLVVLDFQSGDVVGILKPADKAKLEALLRKGDDPAVSREIEGWTVVAENEAALDRFEQARTAGVLADDPTFREAMEGLPEEALTKLYVNGGAATRVAEQEGGVSTDERNQLKAFAGALGAESSGLRLDGRLNAELEPDLANLKAYEPTLLEAAPVGPLAFVSGNGHGKVTESLDHLPGAVGQLRRMLGFDIEGLFGLLEGEFALWVGQGLPIPEVTFVAETKDEEQGLAALDRLAGVLASSGDAERRTTRIDGVTARQVVAEGVTISYAALDGKVILTTRPGAIADVGDGGESLADDPDFQQAREDANMGDTTFGFVYVDVGKVADLVVGFAGLSGADVPEEVGRNLEPLGPLLVNSSGEPEDLKLSAFLAIE